MTALCSFYYESTGIMVTQSAPYIEDGWYIESHPDGKIKVFEIPLHGGDNMEMGEFTNFKEAYEFALSLT